MKKSIFLFVMLACYFIQPASAQNNTWYTFPPNTFEPANRFIHVDDNDVKWVSSYDSGIARFSNGQLSRFDPTNSPISNNDIRQSCFDTAGNLWMATWDGLSKYDTTSHVWTTFNVTGQLLDVLFSVQADEQNRIWVGTDGGADPDDGLYMYDGTSWTFYNPTNSPMTGRWIFQIKKDRNGKLWASHSGGLLEINGTTITNHLFTDAGLPPNTLATGLDFDSYNNKWMGLNAGGIAKFDGTNWTVYNTSNSPMPDNIVWSLAVDHDDVVWTGTETGGLVKFDGVNWTIYNTTNSDITNDRIDAIAVDKLNNIWIAPNYGGILVHNPSAISGIAGKVYHDINGNHVMDANEPPLPNEIIRIDSTLFTTITNAAGNYYCPILNSGDYTAKLAANSPYITAIYPDSINFSITNTATNLTGNDFGVQLTPAINDVSVDFTPVNVPRPGFSYTCNLQVKNNGSITAHNISVKLKYNQNLLLDSVSYPYLLQQGDSINWLIDSLPVFEKQSIKIYFHVPANPSLLGTQLNFPASANTILPDQAPNNNIYTGHDVIRGSYDPNDKQVDPKGIGSTGAISSATDSLTYTIRFQNTGNAEAINIIVRDTLDPGLDLSTLKMISASHVYSISIKQPNIISWTFNNINLPDSNTNNAASNGYIKFNVKLKPALAQGTTLTNTAYIFFDFNPAVATNEVFNTIDDAVVPVGIFSFAASCDKGTPVLSWRTEPGSGTKTFGIETSADGNRWVTIGQVPASGDHAVYQFNDPVRTHVLYRLYLLDSDGHKSYSEIISGDCRDAGNISVYPVPVNKDLYIKINNAGTSYAVLDIIDINGKTLLRENKTLSTGLNNIYLDVSILPPGTYFLRITAKRSVAVRKIIVGQ